MLLSVSGILPVKRVHTKSLAHPGSGMRIYPLHLPSLEMPLLADLSGSSPESTPQSKV